MDKKDMDNIINKIAADEEVTSLESVEKAIDYILYGIQIIEEQLPQIKTDIKEEQDARDKIQNIFETAINPYVADVIENLDILSGVKE